MNKRHLRVCYFIDFALNNNLIFNDEGVECREVDLNFTILALCWN